ncbi:MAG: hypothetical protein M3135_08475, partial [Actinomycetota bacterium]|nr:hypothetical protein [Actinomycetota bacterium]
EQAALLGGARVGVEEVSRLIGTPDLEEHFSMADAVAVGGAREVFGIIHRLVEAGHDLRYFTTQVTGHFRNLLLALSSPDDPAILDVPAEVHPRLVAQAGKYSAAELNRILALLLQAQTDMRWTTSPRLTLELALVRAALPETDPQPAGLISRIERLERRSGIHQPGGAAASPPGDQASASDISSTTGTADERPHSADASASTTETDTSREKRPRSDGPSASSAEKASDTATSEAATADAVPVEPTTTSDHPSDVAAEVPSPVGAVDTEMLRRGWGDVVETLRARRHMQLHATAQLATVGSFDGDTMELVFPPGREFGARKVEEKSAQLVDVLGELFGVRPKLRCTVRQGMALEPETDEPPPSPEAAEALLRSQFGAEVVEDE